MNKGVNITVDIHKESSYVCPSSIFSMEDLVNLQSFYQYRTANKKDSPLSLDLDGVLSDAEKDQLWIAFLQATNALDSDFIFNSILRNKIADIQQLELSDTTLICDRVKGFLQKNSPPKTGRAEHKIDALLKRIRNAFAHGRIAQDRGYLIFEDKREQLTARIVLTTEVLLTWKSVIEKFPAERNQNVTTNSW